jgi:hypothetical protein
MTATKTAVSDEPRKTDEPQRAKGQPSRAEEEARAKWEAAKQAAADQVAAATAAEAEARERLDALRERHMTETDVTAEEFAEAGTAIAAAEAHRAGTEELRGVAGHRERLEVLRAIRDDMEASIVPGRTAELFKQAADALSDLLSEIGPEHRQMVMAWLQRLRQLGVPMPQGTQQPSPEDLNIAWTDGGSRNIPAVSWMTDRSEHRTVRGTFDWEQILAALVTRAARKAGMNSQQFGISTYYSDTTLITDPDKWFKHHG